MLTYVKVYFDFLDSIEPLSDEEAGRLFRGILEYAKTGVLPEFIGNERYTFPEIRKQIDREQEHYDAVSLARSEAGKNGGRPKATETKAKQTKAKESKKSNCTQDKDKDKDKDNTIYSALEVAMDEFKQFRKSIKAPLNELSEKKIRNELDRLTSDESVKVQILDQSIRNGWKGVFALKGRNYAEHRDDLDHLLTNLDEV